MTSDKCILVVDDERVIQSFLTAILSAEGYRVLCAETGQKALLMTASHNPDLVLLDLGLPDMDGMEVLRRVREWSDVPIIVVSARQEEKDKVSALDSGAVDYITKPFGNLELFARIRNALRLRERLRGTRAEQPSIFYSGPLRIDYTARRVSVDGRDVHLTPIEYKIVGLLARNAGKVLTHDFIVRDVWGQSGADSQILRVNMANIRRKLESNPSAPVLILTEVGVGYRMNIDI